jgi:hypothetical protein
MGHGGVSSTTATVRVNDLNGGVDPLVSNLECVLTFFPKDSAGPSLFQVELRTLFPVGAVTHVFPGYVGRSRLISSGCLR